jgi:hypothetical protein
LVLGLEGSTSLLIASPYLWFFSQSDAFLKQIKKKSIFALESKNALVGLGNETYLRNVKYRGSLEIML